MDKITISNFGQRDKAILIGLFLSRFGKKALSCLGFSGFMEAYNILGFSIGVEPLSIRGYRDEFDPYFDNGRKGWHNRKLREYCKNIMDKAKDFSLEDFKNLINSFVLDKDVDIADIKTKKTWSKSQTAIFNRLVTGKAAEEYFATKYQMIEPFQKYQIKDTTNMGCGFDFKLSLDSNNYYIEVKGINGLKGSLLMTEKEYNMAENLAEKYCLFIVSNFKKTPIHHLFFNPLFDENLSFQKNERKIVQVSYTVNLSKDYTWSQPSNSFFTI